MKCPVCDAEPSLTLVKDVTPGVNSVTLNTCTTRCGGIWFDEFELRKFAIIFRLRKLDHLNQIKKTLTAARAAQPRAAAGACWRVPPSLAPTLLSFGAMNHGRRFLAAGVLAGAALLPGCAAHGPYLSAGAAHLGSDPYEIGPVTVVVRPQPQVELICRLRAPSVAPSNVRIQGCYVPKDRMIVSTPDPFVLLHEFKHHFEGGWHE
jgi:Zn-finger nucleic acid-binding protein